MSSPPGRGLELAADGAADLRRDAGSIAVVGGDHDAFGLARGVRRPLIASVKPCVPWEQCSGPPLRGQQMALNRPGGIVVPLDEEFLDAVAGALVPQDIA